MSTHHHGAGHGTKSTTRAVKPAAGTCFSCRKTLKISQAAATFEYKNQRWLWCFQCWDADDAEQPGGAVDAYRIMSCLHLTRNPNHAVCSVCHWNEEDD